jgi:hypothetical protein
MELSCVMVDLFSKYSVSLGDKNYKLKWRESWVVCPENTTFSFTPLK